jgi:hypothetical protein
LPKRIRQEIDLAGVERFANRARSQRSGSTLPDILVTRRLPSILAKLRAVGSVDLFADALDADG